MGMKRLVIVLMPLLMLLVSCKPAQVKETADPVVIAVRMTPVVVQEISMPVRSAGMVATSEEVRLSFKTGGIVARTYVGEGESVKKGQLLAALNLAEINAQVSQATNAHEKAKRDFGRARNLFTDSVATLEQLQNAETALNVSKSVLDMAQFNLAHSKIIAPRSGVILKQLVRENELVAPGFPVYALGISGKNWIIRTALSDRDVVKVQPGDTARVSIDAWPDEPFTAVVSQIDESSNPMTGTYEIELNLGKTDKRLSYGFIANVEIMPSRKVPCQLVPMAAVVEADGRTGFVYTVTPSGKAKKVRVTIATLHGTQAAISAGLENIPEVVSEGVAYLNEGANVEIRRN